jgi:hypothetical protein
MTASPLVVARRWRIGGVPVLDRGGFDRIVTDSLAAW